MMDINSWWIFPANFPINPDSAILAKGRRRKSEEEKLAALIR